MAAAVSREVQPGCRQRCPCPKLVKNLDVISPAGVSCALSSNTSALIDELLDIDRVESQRASARPHLDGWQIGLALTRGMLDNP
jgi:hypothetical protein